MGDFAQAVEYWLRELGVWGYPLAVLLMAAVALLPIPAEIPAAMNGMLFGPLPGTIITWTGAMVGAQLSFEISRRFGRPAVRRFVPGRAISRVDSMVRVVSWPGLLMARLIPAVAFTALNWGLGLTGCRRRTFVWTTAIGILPATILFVYTGEGIARLYAQQPLLTLVLASLAVALLILIARRHDRPNT